MSRVIIVARLTTLVIFVKTFIQGLLLIFCRLTYILYSRYSQVTAFDVTSNETRDLRKQIQSYFSKHSNNKNSKKEFTFSKAIPSGSKFLDTLNRGRPQSNQKASNHNNNASNSNKGGGGGGGGVSKKKNKKRKVPAGSSSSRPTSTSRPPSRPPNRKNSSHFKGKRNN